MEQTSLVDLSTSTVYEIPSTADKFLIGRGSRCSLVLGDMSVSRTHCILERNNGDWHISDKSLNGTWVNGRLVDKSNSQLLVSDDMICLSTTIKLLYNKTSQQIADAANTGNSQEPSCSKDISIAKTERNYFQQIEDELQCSICREMFVKAMTLNCSHTFCKSCIAQWQKKQTICPICRTKVTMQTPTLVVDNVIEKVLEFASEEVKQHHRELIAEREAATAASTSSNCPSRRRANEIIEIDDSDDEMLGGDEEDEDDVDDQDDYDEDEYDMSDEDDDMEF